MKTAIAFLCKHPSIETINFGLYIANKTDFDVFFISDEIYYRTQYSTSTQLKLLSKCRVIQVSDETCRNFNFINSNISDNATHIKKNPIAWDKMLYFFCAVETSYDFVWVFEDDVFIPSVDVLCRLDAKYSDYDLVTPNHFKKKDTLKDWHWAHIFDKIDPPYFYSMVCACGMSKNLFKAIRQWVEDKKELLYIEVFFNTLAHQKGLRVTDAKELKSIVWQGKWGLDEFLLLPDNLFHPIKITESHENLRVKIEKAKQQNYIPNNNLPDFLTKIM